MSPGGGWQREVPALLVTVVLVVSGCGTRKEAANGAGGGGRTAAAVQVPTTEGSAPATAAGAGTTVSPAPAVAEPSASALSASVSPGRKAREPASSAVASPPASSSQGSAPARQARSGTPVPQPPDGSPVPPTAPDPVPGPWEKQPIVIGNVGTWSGPLGNAFAGAVAGSLMWARSVNDRGGIEGHPVKVISLDDAGDPARSKANVKELVERRGAVAFMADFSPVTRSAHSAYLLEKGIPVIGGDQGTPEWHQSPVYFRAGANAMVLVYGAVYEAAQLGKKKLAFLYCVEIPDCKTASVVGGKAAGEQGMSMVYRGGISVGQPDYTAECLQAQRAGADTVYVLGDPNTVGRFTRSCDRQGYHPLYIGASGGIDNNLSSAVGVQGGLRATQPQPPWFLRSETPAIRSYAEAKQRYASGSKEGQDVMIGWVAGRMIERALANADPLASSVQPGDFLRGLGQFRDETIDGLIPPTTFTKDQPTTDQGRCWHVIAVVDGKWTAPNGAKPTCLPNSPRV